MLIGENFTPEPQVSALAGKMHSLSRKTERKAPISAALNDLGGFLDEIKQLADPVTVNILLTKREVDKVAQELGILSLVSAAGIVPAQCRDVYPWYRQTIAQAEIFFTTALMGLDGIYREVSGDLVDRFRQDPIRFFGTEDLYEETWKEVKREGIVEDDRYLAMVRRSGIGTILMDMHRVLVEAGEIKNALSNNVLPLVETTLQVKSPGAARE